MTRRINKADLQDLLAKLKAGGGPGDYALCLGTLDQLRWCDEAWKGSFGAAYALHKALIPGWSINMSFVPYGVWHVDLSDNHTGWATGKFINATNEDPARAWTLAIVEALIWQCGGGE